MTPRQELLERIRKQYPTYKDAPDDWLASQIATKYPAYRDALAYEQKLPAGWIGPKPLTSLLVHEGGDRLLELEEEERQGRRGFWEALTDVSSKDLPVIGAFTDAHEMNNMAKLVRRLNKGENLTDAELVKLNLFQAYQKRVANANALGIAGGITRQSIPFMIELAASVAAVLSVADGPTADIAVIGATLGRVTGQSAAREAYEQVLKAGAKSGLRGAAQRYAARPAALRAGLEVVTKDVQSKLLQKMPGLSPSMAYAAGRVAVDLPLYSGLTMAATALNVPRTWVASPARENLIAAFKNEDIKAQDAYLHGFVNAWIENASEYSGGMLGAVLGGTLKSLPGAARVQAQARILGGVSQALLHYRFPNAKITNIGQTLRSFGVGNMFEEFAEERYADFARGLLGYEGNSAGLANAITNMIPSMEQTAGELMAFAIPGVAMGAADLALRKRDSRRSDTANAERARALLAHASNGDIAPQVGMGLRLLNTLQAEGGSPQEVDGVRAAVMAAAVAQSPEDLRGALEGIRSTLAPLPPDSLVRRRLGAIVENVPETLLTPRPDSPWSTLEALDNLGFGRDPEMPQAPPDVAQGRQPLPGVIRDPARGEVVVTEGALQADQVLEPPATSQPTPAAPPATSQPTPAAPPATSQPAPVIVPRNLDRASAAELKQIFTAVRERWWPAPGETSAPVTAEQFSKARSFITPRVVNYQHSNPMYRQGAGPNVSLEFRDWASAAIYTTTAEAANSSMPLRQELRAATGLTDSQIFSYGAWMRDKQIAPMYDAGNFQATNELTRAGLVRQKLIVPPLVDTPEAWTFDWRPRYEAKQQAKIAAAEDRERAKRGERPAAADLRRQVNLFGEPPATAQEAAPAAPAPVAEAEAEAEAAPAAPAPVAEAAPAAPAPVVPAPVRRAREAIAANELYAAAVAAGGFRPTPVTGDALQTLKMQRELGAFKQIPARKRYQDYEEWEGLPGWLRSPTRDSGITMSQFYTNVADHVQNPGLVEEIQALSSWKHLYNSEYFGGAPSYQELAKTLTSDDLDALAAKQAKEEADLEELKKVARIRSSAWIMRQLPVGERAYHVDSDTWVTVKQHDTDPKSPNYRKSLVEWRDDFGLGELEWVPWYIGNLPNEFVLGRPPGPRLTLPPKVVQGGAATTIFRKNLDPAQITPKFLLEELVRELKIDPQAAEFFRDTVNRAATLVTTSSGHTRVLFSPDKAIARDIIEEMFHSLRPFLPTQALVPLAKWINSRNEEAIANVTEFVPSYKWDEPGVSRDPVFATNQDGSSFTEEALFREENWRYRKIPLVVKRGDTHVVRHILVDELVAQAFMADLDDQWKSPWPGETPEKKKTDWGLRTPKSWRRVLEETSEQLKDLLVQYPLLRSLFRAMESMLDAWARIAKQWRGENAVRGAERELLPRQGMGGLFGTVAPRDWQKSVYIAFDTILTPPRLPSKLASRGKARAARPVLAGPLAEEGSEQPNLYQPKPVEYEGVRALTITPEEYDALLETKRKQLEDVLMRMHDSNMVEEDRPIVADAIARMWGNMAVNISHLLRQPQDVRDVERQVLDIANSFMAATQSKEILVARGQMPDDAGQVVMLKKGDAGFRATQAETEVWKIVMASRIRSMPADLLRPDSTTQASGEESEEAAQGLLVGPGLTFPSKDDLALAAAGSVTIQNFVRAIAAGKARNYLRNSRGYPRPPPTTEAARELADYTDADAMLWQQFVGDVATTVYHSTRAMLLHAFTPTAVKKFSYREMLEDGTYRTYGPEEAQSDEPADQEIARQAKVPEGGKELVGWYRALIEAMDTTEADEDAGAAQIFTLQQGVFDALSEETLESHATVINQELPPSLETRVLVRTIRDLFDESTWKSPLLVALIKRVAELRAPRPAAAATGKSGDADILYASDNPLSDFDEPAPAPTTPRQPVTSNFFQRYRDAFQRLLGFDPTTQQTESDQEIVRLVHDIFDGPNRVQGLSVQTATALRESADLLNNLALSLAGEGTIPDALPIALKAELILRAQPRLVELRLGEGNLAEAERFKEVLNRLRDEIQISGTRGGRIGRFSGIVAQALLMGSDSIKRHLEGLREQRAKRMTPEIRNIEEKAKQVVSVLDAPYDTEAEAAEAEAAVKKGAEPAAVETALRDRSKPKPRDPGELARAGRDALDALMDEVMEQGHIAAQQAVAGFADGYNGKHDFFRNNRMFRSPNANVMAAADAGGEFWREFLPKINQILAKAMVLSPSEWASTRMNVAKDFLQDVSPEDADSLEAQTVALHMLDVALLSFWRSTSTRLRLLFGDAPKEPQLRPGGTPAAPAAVTEISVEQAQRQLNATYLQVRARLGDNATNEDIDAYHDTVRAIVNGQIAGMSPELIEAGRRIARRLHLPHLPPRQLNDVQVLARQLQKILQDRIPGEVPKPPQTSPFDLIRLMFSEAGSEKMNQVAQAALAELMAKYGLTRDQIELAEVFGAGEGLREDVRRKLLVLNQVFELAGVSLSALDKISPFKGAPVGFLSKLIARAVSEEIRLMPEFQHIATQGPIAQRMAVEELRHRMMQRLGLSGASAEIIADQVSRAGMEHIRKAKETQLRRVAGKEFTDEYLDEDFLMRVGRHVFSGALKPTRLRLRYAEFLNSMVEGPWTADLVNFYDQLRNPLLAPANSQELVAKWVKESKDWPGGEQELQRAIGTLESLTAIVRSFDHEISEQRSMRLDDWLSRRFNLPNITQDLRDTLQRYGDAWDRMMYEDLQYRKEFLRAVGEEGPALPSNEGMLYREDYQILAQATQEALMRTAGISKLDLASSTFYMHLLSSLSAQEINFISTAVQALETTGLMAVVSAHRLAKDKPLAERFGIFSRIMGEAWRGTLDGFRVNWTETWRTGRPRGPASLVAQQTGKGAPRLFESGIVEDFPVFFQKWIRFWRHGTRALAGTDLSFKRGAMQASLVRDIERAIRDGKINEQQAAIYRSLFVWGGQYDLRTPLGQQQVLDDISKLAPEDGYRKLLNGQFHLLRLAHARAKKEGYDPASNAYRLRVEELVFVQRDMPLSYLAQGEAIATGLSDKGILDFLQAEYIGGRATFNIHPDDPIFAGTFLTDAKETINKFRDLHPVMNFLVPFTSVVTAVLQSRINSTPFGFYRAKKLSAANRYGLHETSEDDIAQLKLQAAIGVGLSVSLLALAMTAMVGDPDDPLFEITGRGPSDPRLRNQLRARGWKEHTVKIGALRLGYLDSPMALNLAFLGAFLDSARYDKQSHSSLIARTAFASLELVPTFVDQTYLSSASRLLEAATGASPELRERAFLRWGTGLASGLLIPSAVKQLNRFFDPTLYQANDLMGLVLRETPIMQARMLLGLDPALNAFGEPIKMGTPSALLGVVRAPLDNPVSLGRIGVLALNPDPLWSYLVRHNLVVPTVGRAIMVGGVELTDEQLYKYTRVRGRLLKAKLEQALEATSWAPMSQEALDKLAAQASREAKLAITEGPATVGAAAVATPEMLYSRW